ncbi:EamA family transporter [Micromonospora matsumotoense]|uniref:EamA family transporter n=1 Tax=Micromonospora matsumotoense TaxID=121616 RepID=UPI0033CA0CF2
MWETVEPAQPLGLRRRRHRRSSYSHHRPARAGRHRADLRFAQCGLRRAGATTAGTLSLAEPLAAALLSTTLLGEDLSGREWAGCTVILAGLLLTVATRGGSRPGARGVRGRGELRIDSGRSRYDRAWSAAATSRT